MRMRVLLWPSSLCLCLILATPTAAAEVTEADFDAPRDQVDATVERLAAMDFTDTARPAATVLARRKPEFMIYGSDPRKSEAEQEADRRRSESTAYTVARLVWHKRTADPHAQAVTRVLGEIATDRRTDADIRRVAIETLVFGTLRNHIWTDERRDTLYEVASQGQDDAALRKLAAYALVREPSGPTRDEARYDAVLQDLPGIIRAQPTLAARHEAFNDLTNIGNRLHRLPFDRLTDLIRVGFELIEETPVESSGDAYFTARHLGYMLKRADEFVPPKGKHRDANGNLAPSFFQQTVENARWWWDKTGHNAMDAIAPVKDED